MKIDTDKAREIFKRAVEVQKMILAAMEDLKQLRADEIEALIDDGMDKDAKKAIRADLSEIIALAKIEAKGEMEREKVAAKMEHRREVAEAVGVQLDMLGAGEAAEDEQDLVGFVREASFDVVRVSPTGEAVIAGRGAPNAPIVILDGEKEIGRVTCSWRRR